MAIKFLFLKHLKSLLLKFMNDSDLPLDIFFKALKSFHNHGEMINGNKSNEKYL